ncbi:MAG: beta-mannosidase [Bdellovibrio sp.]|nr:beta-mannosidase [Bdellovibrio sp.]
MVKPCCLILFFLILLLPFAVWGGGGKSVLTPRPSDKHLTSLTQKLFDMLIQLKGRGVLFGHQDVMRSGHTRDEIAFESDVQQVSGKWPAVMGLDFREPINWPQSFWGPYKDMILHYHALGGIVTLAWHMNNPVTLGNHVDKTPAVRAILPGGNKHALYLTWLDTLARFLNELKDVQGRAIPILFRPFHEHNGDWFWWSLTDRECKMLCFIPMIKNYYLSKADDDFVHLFRFTINYLRRVRAVHNILVVYSPGLHREGKDYLWRYPGDDYVDVMGFDRYEASVTTLLPSIRRIVEEAHKRGKIAALTETGSEGILNAAYWTEDFLTPLKNDPMARQISYVMVWRNSGTQPEHFYAPFPGHPSVPSFREMERDPYSLFLEDLPTHD